MDSNGNIFLDRGLFFFYYVWLGKFNVKVDSNGCVVILGFFIYFIISLIFCNDIEVINI